MDASVALAISTLSNPIKDLCQAGKEKLNITFSKWKNEKAIQNLVIKVAAYEKVKTIWQRDKFVKLTSFYYPSNITLITGITKTISSLKDFPLMGGLVLQGTVGQGKSIFLRYLCIQELRNHSSGRIPVLVELRKIASMSLKSTVMETLENLGFEISDELFDFYADSGKIVLLLDGFDELNETQTLSVIAQLENWAVRYPSFQVIVSSRPGGDIQKSPHFTVFSLAPLAPSDHRPFLLKIGISGTQLDNMLAAVELSDSQVREFLNTPLLLTLLTMVYKSDGTIPAQLPEFFEKLFETVFSKHDGMKPGFKRQRKTDLNDGDLELFFESFCYSVMKLNYGVSLGNEEFINAFNDALKYPQKKCDRVAFRHDLVKIACLLLEEGYRLDFAHKSILEYFCASFIKKTTEKQSQGIYDAIKLQQRWLPVLQYLRYIDLYKYSKYFAIPKLTEFFEYFGITDCFIPDKHPEIVFNQLFKDCKVYFHINDVTGNYQQNAVDGYYEPPTIFGSQLFYSLVLKILPFAACEFTISEVEAMQEDKNLSMPWIKSLSLKRKLDILLTLKNNLQDFSNQLRKAKQYVQAEDDKTVELLNFEVINDSSL